MRVSTATSLISGDAVNRDIDYYFKRKHMNKLLTKHSAIEDILSQEFLGDGSRAVYDKC
jgi:hypothetical protein